MKIILASQSPRRIELLKQYVFSFETIPSQIEEYTCESDSPEKTVMGLAYQKARLISKEHPNALVIASDTLVYLDGPLGKPSSKAEAFRMLKSLSGKTHSVYTGVALLCERLSKKVVFFERTEVSFNELTDEMITHYIEKENTLDKAGAYGIQGLGAVLVNAIHGDFYNVMGLPLSHLNQKLKEVFDFNLL